MHVGRTLIAWFLVLLTASGVPSGAAVAGQTARGPDPAAGRDIGRDGEIAFRDSGSRVAEAGLEIVNVARLSYFDAAGDTFVEVESNTARIVVGELRRFALGVPGTVERLAGERVAFVHRLENTGNVADRYALTLGNALGDEGDLIDLLLVVDANGNGLADVDETPPDERVALAPGESLELVASGRVPDDVEADARIDVDLVARSVDESLAPQSLTDRVRVLDSARLRLSWVASSECEAGFAAGAGASLTLEARNASATLPPAREVLVDGEVSEGVLIETTLPEAFLLDPDAAFDVMAFRGLALVRERNRGGAGWMRHGAWSGKTSLERIAMLVPAASLARDDVVGMTFGVRASRSAPRGRAADVEGGDGFRASVEGDSAGAEVGAVRLDCAYIFEPASAIRASIRFVRPILALQRALEAPRLGVDEDFVDASHYRLDTGSGEHRLVRDGVYVELVAGVSTGRRLASADGTAHVLVDVVARSTGDRARLVLRESVPGSNVWRSLQPIRPGEGYRGDGRRCPGDGPGSLDTTPDYVGDGDLCVLGASVDDVLDVTFVDSDGGADVADTAVIDPVGRVFDATTLAGVAGAKITVRAGDRVATDPLTDEPLVIASGKDGRYGLPRLPAGTFHLVVEPPATHVFPSSFAPRQFEVDAVGAASYGLAGYLGEGDGRFTVAAGEPAPVVDVPLDPVDRERILMIEKSATSESVEPGESVGYRVVLANRGDTALDDATVLDTPPLGFRYVRGSARLDRVRIADPERLRVGTDAGGSAAGADASAVVAGLRFEIGTLEPESESTLAYELEATAGALDGDGVNTATAAALTAGGLPLTALRSQARVDVRRDGVLSGRAILFGKVYVDASCDGLQNQGEWPIGGVRLYLDDGTFVITDEDGQFSLYELEPGLRALKVDPLTLPEGLVLKPLDTANAADADSRFVELSEGDFHRADFAASCPPRDAGGVFARLAERNADLRGAWLLEEAARFDPDGTRATASDAQRADTDGDLSSGLLGAPRAAGTSAPARDEERGADPAAALDEAAVSDDATDDGFPVAAADDDGRTLSPPLASGGSKGPANGDAALATGVPSGNDVAMGDPKTLAATITAAQAQAGAWLWPEGELSTDGRFMAVVRAGVEPTLFVNGVAVPSSQIGERIENRRESAQIVAWYGVRLVPGPNVVEVRARDGFGNERVLATDTFKRPAAGVRMILRARQDTLPADGGRSMLPIDVVITDANGYPASGVYFVTLETTAGSFLEPDLQSREPGVQVRIEDGRGKIHVRSSELTGRLRVTARTGALEAGLNLVQIAAARPLIGVGVIEIGGRFGSASGGDGRADLEDGFETGTHASVFLKGRVRGDAKLTLAYDTDGRDDELLRDTGPDGSYPTLGDASVRGFEAQSRSKLYLKLERDRHSVMWGDYLTDSQAESDDLARVQRTLTGLNGVYDDSRTRVQGFVARQSALRGSEEIRGNGTAMLFRLEGAPIVANSEVIERIVRDRDNPGLVLEATRLLRFADYTLDPVAGLLSFADVVPSVDEALNPVFIRASYDTRAALDEHTVSGLRVQRAIGRSTRVGASLTDDANPLSGYTIAGVHLAARPGANTRLTASAAGQRHRTERADGQAVRVQLEHEWGGRRDFRTLMSWARTNVAFDNPGAGVAPGREEWRVEHRHPVGNTVEAVATAIGSDSTVDGTGYASFGVTLEKTFADWSVTGGARHLRSRDASGGVAFDTVLLGATRRFVVGGRQASVGVDHERDVADAGRFRYGVESRLQAHDHVSLYVRYERERGIAAQSLLGVRGGSEQLVAGIESDVLPGARAYSEYRMRGAFTGRAMESASGVRGRYEIEPGLALSPALEVVDALGGNAEDSIALSVGVSDSRDENRKLTAQAEWRDTASSTYLGLRTTLAQRLDLDWTGLVREEYTRQAPDVGELSSRQRFTLGLARRPKLDNAHHVLMLASWKADRGPEDGQDKSTWVLSTHQNRELGEDVRVNARGATKWRSTRYARGTRDSRAWLFDLRTTVDIARRFEVDLRGGFLGTGEVGEGRWSAGAGLAWLVDRNVRLAVSYNLLGFRDEDLDEQGYNAQGLSIGLQLKFDEDLFRWLEP